VLWKRAIRMLARIITGTTLHLAATAAALAAFSSAARADFQLCSRMSYVVEAAIAIEDKGAAATRGWFRIDPEDGTAIERVGGDELLFADGRSRDQPYVVIVTGAGRGLGRAHALEFARQGAAVVVNDIGVELDGQGGSSGPAGEVVAEIKASGGRAIANGADVADWEQTRDLVKSALAAFGRLDAVVNNADRKVGHLLPLPDGHVYGVDHGICFNEEPKLRTVLWHWRGDRLTGNELEVLRALHVELAGALGDALAPLLAEAEIAATGERIRSLIADGRFPHPDPDRPAIPWPPY